MKVDSDGYVKVLMPGHPLAQATGYVLEHRVLLYDRIGEGPHRCHHCGRPNLGWFASGPNRLVVDHLDDNRANNEARNIVPSCHACNVGRATKVHHRSPLMERKHEESRLRKRRQGAARSSLPRRWHGAEALIGERHTADGGARTYDRLMPATPKEA